MRALLLNDLVHREPMTTTRLEQAIQRYSASIDSLPPDVVSSAEVLDVLTARDEVKAALEDTTQTSGKNLDTIHQLDGVLKSRAETISQYRKTASQSADWQASFNPTPEAWWWALEPPQQKWTDRFDWLWSAGSVTCLTISLGLLGDISTRFLAGGPDTFGALTISTQTVLTLLAAGGTLTKAGQEAVKRTATNLKIPQHYWHEVSIGASGLVLLSLVGLRLSLPNIATLYSNWGQNNFEQGDWSSAEENYKRALQLNPDDAEAHFRLGRLYEDLQNLDGARTEYKLAMPGNIPLAYSNLARLNILKKDYPGAVNLLLKILEPPEDKKIKIEPLEKYLILKNLGWARLKQKDYAEAKVQLEEAIALKESPQLRDKLKENIAAPHCLLAQVYQAQNNKSAASDQWSYCLGNANRGNPDEDSWVILAHRQSKPQEIKK
jgi:tetratricopeptide (TPR) repeat protein